MPALVAGIHVFSYGTSASKTWMAGTSPDKPGHDSAKLVQYNRTRSISSFGQVDEWCSQRRPGASRLRFHDHGVVVRTAGRHRAGGERVRPLGARPRG